MCVGKLELAVVVEINNLAIIHDFLTNQRTKDEEADYHYLTLANLS